jgi:hypothetical protein
MVAGKRRQQFMRKKWNKVFKNIVLIFMPRFYTLGFYNSTFSHFWRAVKWITRLKRKNLTKHYAKLILNLQNKYIKYILKRFFLLIIILYA